jgi:hypothetical protein
MFFSMINGIGIFLCILRIKNWCRNRWLLRYMLTDDSAGEQTAVRKAFPGLDTGEMEVNSSAIAYSAPSQRSPQQHFSNDAKGSTSNNGCKPFLQPIETGYPIGST